MREEVITTKTLEEHARDYLDTVRANSRSPRTIQTYHWALQRLLRGMEGDSIDGLDVTRFLNRLDAGEFGHRSEASRHIVYRVVRSFVRYLMDLETPPVRGNPLKGLRRKVPDRVITVPTKDEIQALLKVCGRGWWRRRNLALLLVMADAGLRASEVCRLLVEDYDRRFGRLRVRGKGGKVRMASLNPKTRRALKSWLTRRTGAGGEDFLFTTRDERPFTRRGLHMLVTRLSDRAGIPPERRIHPHAFRHFAGTSWSAAGMGLDQVRRVLGHSTLSTALLYLSLTDDDVARAHRKAAAIEDIDIE